MKIKTFTKKKRQKKKKKKNVYIKLYRFVCSKNQLYNRINEYN